MKSEKSRKLEKRSEKQSIGGVIATYFQMLLALGCIVMFFCPFFKFLDSDSSPFATISQIQLLFGGVFPRNGSESVRLDGSISFLTGVIAPIFMAVVLYFRNAVRRLFAYFFHALVSVAFLIHIFTTKSVASAVVRSNADAVNYQVDWGWFAAALLTVLGFAISVLLILSELSRLRDAQRQFEEDEDEEYDDDDEYEDDEDDVRDEEPRQRAPREPAEVKRPPFVAVEFADDDQPAVAAAAGSSEDDLNQSIAQAIGVEEDDDYYDDDEQEKVPEAAVKETAKQPEKITKPAEPVQKEPETVIPQETVDKDSDGDEDKKAEEKPDGEENLRLRLS